ncbi:hypothetical protein ATCC90586_008586 [Pythium insidiosum]|nr:hypothetical protein ATCC90586_008586 [Pythium insidiosum]
MDDIYAELEQHAKAGRMRLPAKFVDFHRSEVMYLFTRAAVGYGLAFVRVRNMEREAEEHRQAETSTLAPTAQTVRPSLHALNQHAAVSMPLVAPSSVVDRLGLEQQSHLDNVRAQQMACATALGETYARLVLHCSNFEHHKEDEHFFECIYFFVCSVVKVGLAPEHWRSIESELAFLFRGTHFSSNVKNHSSDLGTGGKAIGFPGGGVLSAAGTSTTASASTSTGTAASNGAAAGSTGSMPSGASAGGPALSTTASAETTPTKRKIQQLSLHGAISSNTAHSNAGGFVLPPATSPRCRYFPESFPVQKIVTELDAVKFRAARNIEASQSLRERIAESHASRRPVRRPSDSALLGRDDGQAPSQSPRQLRGRCVSGTDAPSSPRLSMKSTFTARSPAVNHLLPAPDDRVRIALEYVFFSVRLTRNP